MATCLGKSRLCGLLRVSCAGSGAVSQFVNVLLSLMVFRMGFLLY